MATVRVQATGMTITTSTLAKLLENYNTLIADSRASNVVKDETNLVITFNLDATATE